MTMHSEGITDADLDRFEKVAEPIYRSTATAGEVSRFQVSDLGMWVVRLVGEVRRLRGSFTPEKTPEQIAVDTVGHWMADLSDERTVLAMVTQAIETDRAQRQGEPSEAKVEAVARRLFGATVDSMTRARELARIALNAKPLVECPHWAPGKITFRNGCTACAADAAGGVR